MPIPIVTCSPSIYLHYANTGPRLVQLGAVATGSPTAWRWTVLSAPAGSVVMTGTKGNFTDGYAVIQNPQIQIDDMLDGTYVIQCVATNGSGSSDPSVDKENGQQLIIVQIGRELPLPGDGAYNWGNKILIPALRKIARNFGDIEPDTYDLPSGWNAAAFKYYVDGDNGNDDNDGLTWDTALRTLDAFWCYKLPTNINNAYICEFRGAVGDDGPIFGGWFTGKTIYDNGRVLIMGEQGTTDIAGPFTATASGGGWTYQVTGAGWSNDQWTGKWIRIASGNGAGQYRSIIRNGPDLIFLGAGCFPTGGIGAGDVFYICKPKSTYTGYLGILAEGHDWPWGINLMHFNHVGNGRDIEFYGSGRFEISRVISDNYLWAEGKGPNDQECWMLCNDRDMDPVTASPINVDDDHPNYRCGNSFATGMGFYGASVEADTFFAGGKVTFDECRIRQLGSFNTNRHSRIVVNGADGLEFTHCWMTDPDSGRSVSWLDVEAQEGGQGNNAVIIKNSRINLGPMLLFGAWQYFGVWMINSHVMVSEYDAGSGPASFLMTNEGTLGLGGFGLRHGSHLRIRCAAAGEGGTLTKNGSTMTIQQATWGTGGKVVQVGCIVQIFGNPLPGNDGTFVVTAVDMANNRFSYVNANGTAGSITGGITIVTWIPQNMTGPAGDVRSDEFYPNGTAITWLDVGGGRGFVSSLECNSVCRDDNTSI